MRRQNAPRTVTSSAAMTGLTGEALDALGKHLDAEDQGTGPVVLDVGFSNVVVRFGKSVVRVARNEKAAAGHRREAAVLPVLLGRLPAAIPAPVRLVRPERSIPHGAAIHPFLPGSVMAPGDIDRWPDIVGQIARTLASLHGTDVTLFAPGVLPRFDAVAELHNQQRAIGPWLQGHLSAGQRRRLGSWWDRSALVLSGTERTVCHGDAWYGNMLVEEGGLVALLDWQGVCLADPAVDLAPQRYLGPRVADAVVESYVDLRGRTPGLQGRIECYRLLREVGGLAYALGEGMEDEYDDALAKVMRLLE